MSATESESKKKIVIQMRMMFDNICVPTYRFAISSLVYVPEISLRREVVVDFLKTNIKNKKKLYCGPIK